MTAERNDIAASGTHDATVDPVVRDPAVAALRDGCPFLIAADGGWRSVDAIREHRCMAVVPMAPLTLEKQRRLCLTSEHLGCSTFVAARADRLDDVLPSDRRVRPMPRTTPVILERRRFAPIPSIRVDRTTGQIGLVFLLIVAFAGVVLARPDPGGEVGGITGSPSGSPTVTATADTTSTPAASAVAPDVSPTPDAPTASPDATSKPTPTETVAPSSTPATYTVQKGDTLSGIASVYGTTWQEIAALNDIKDPSALRIGTVLQLP